MAKGKPSNPAPKTSFTQKKNAPQPSKPPVGKTPAKQNTALPGAWLVGLLAAVAGLLLYANTMGHDYCLDDFSAIKDNWVTKGGLKNLGTIFTTEYRYGAWGSPGSLYRPAILAMFALEYQLSPENPALNHIINVLLYGATGWVLWITWRRVLADYPPVLAALAVLLFMAHPVHTEVVANIKSRDEIMSLLLSNLALYSVWRHFELKNSTWLGLSVLFYGIGMFCKEGTITFLAVFPLAIWYFTDKGVGTALRITGLLAIPVAIFLLIRYKVLHAQPYQETFSVLDNFMAELKNGPTRIASASMMCGRYLWALLVPHPLISDLGFPQYKPVGFGDWRASVGFLTHVGLATWALANMGKKHFLSFCILFYLAGLSLFSNLLEQIQIGTSYGERLLYVPSLGFVLALAWLLCRTFKVDDRQQIWNPNNKGSLVWGIAGILLLLYGVKTFTRNSAWFDSYSLYMADIGHSPNCAKLHYHLGLEQAKRGGDEKTGTVVDSTWFLKAIDTYTRAIELYPEYHDAYGSRGLAYFRLNKFDKAFTDYQEALKHRPNDARVLSNLGFIYFMRNEFEKAEEVYRKSIQYDARFVDARRNLGAILAMKKQFPAAIEQWKEGLKYEPRNPTLLFYIGSAYRDMGQMDQAQPWLEKAYAEDPSLRK